MLYKDRKHVVKCKQKIFVINEIVQIDVLNLFLRVAVVK
jgi:hypothetical protein